MRSHFLVGALTNCVLAAVDLLIRGNSSLFLYIFIKFDVCMNIEFIRRNILAKYLLYCYLIEILHRCSFKSGSKHGPVFIPLISGMIYLIEIDIALLY